MPPATHSNRWDNLTCSRGNLRCSRIAYRFHQASQLSFRNCKFREATIQTNQKHWKDEHDLLPQTLESREMDGDFAIEVPLAR